MRGLCTSNFFVPFCCAFFHAECAAYSPHTTCRDSDRIKCNCERSSSSAHAFQHYFWLLRGSSKGLQYAESAAYMPCCSMFLQRLYTAFRSFTHTSRRSFPATLRGVLSHKCTPLTACSSHVASSSEYWLPSCRWESKKACGIGNRSKKLDDAQLHCSLH